MQNIKVSIVQTSVLWERPKDNMFSYEKKIESLSDKTDIVIFPEMFASGFTMKVKEKIASEYSYILNWMKSIAAKYGFCVTGTTIYGEEDKYYNRLLFVKPNGDVDSYDKKHLFTMGEENKHFTAGNKKTIIEYKGWKIRPLICYDLRFPVWSRNTKDYDIAIYPANWPDARRDAWMTLLKARAIENQAYVVGVNCVGEDGMGLKYSGDSTVYDAKGKAICACEPYKQEIKTIELDYSILVDFRNKFPVLNDADNFKI